MSAVDGCASACWDRRICPLRETVNEVERQQLYDLRQFNLEEMRDCGADVRALGSDASSMEEVATEIVHYLYDQFVDPQTGKRQSALVRFYKTHPYGELDPNLRRFARSVLGRFPNSPETKCLTLLGTAGDKPEWTSRNRSMGHKTIPLPSAHLVLQIPMIARLLHQFGLEVGTVLKPDPAILVDLEQRTFNAFHVPEAVGSPYIPARTL